MESNLNGGSVIAKLMGLDEPPSHYPAIKKQRVLSEKYLQRVASIGVREKRSISGLHSAKLNFRDSKRTANCAGCPVGVENTDNISVLQESPGILDTNDEFSLKYFQKPQTLFMKQQWHGDPCYSGAGAENVGLFYSEIGTSYMLSNKSSRVTAGKDAHSLQNKPHRSAHENPAPQKVGRFSKSKREPQNGLFCASVSNPGTGNSIRRFSSPSSVHSDMNAAGNHCFSCLGRIVADANRTSKLGSQMNSVSHFYDISESFEQSNETLGSPSITTGKRKYCPSTFTCLAGSKTGVVEKTISKGQTVAKNCEVGLIKQSIPHSGSLTRPCYKYGQTELIYNVKHKLICKRDLSVWKANLSGKNRNICQVRKVASFSSNNSFRTNCKDGIRLAESGFELGNSSTQWLYKSDKQCFNWKHSSQVKNFRSSAHGSLSVLNVERNTAEENTQLQHEIMNNHGEDDISDLSLCLQKDGKQTIELGDDVMLENHAVHVPSVDDDVPSSAQIEGCSRARGNQKEMPYEMPPIDLCCGDCVSPVSVSSVQESLSDIQDAGSVYSSCLDSEPDSLLNFQEACHSSPISVLDSSFGEENFSCSGCFDATFDDAYASENDTEGPEMNISSDEDSLEESADDSEENDKFLRPKESRDFSYLLEVLNESGFYNENLQTISATWHSQECPVSPTVFETLEKKFGQQTSWKRSDRRLIFDQINLGLMAIIQPWGLPTLKTPVVRRLYTQGSHEMVEEELWAMLSVPAKETCSDTEKLFASEFRTDLGEDIDTIARDIVECLVDELAEEIV